MALPGGAKVLIKPLLKEADLQPIHCFASAYLITLAHFSVSSAINRPKSAGWPAKTELPGPPSAEGRIDLPVEPIDYFGRRVGGNANARHCARLVPGDKVPQPRGFRQHRRTRRR